MRCGSEAFDFLPPLAARSDPAGLAGMGCRGSPSRVLEERIDRGVGTRTLSELLVRFLDFMSL
jgi:hypothetical protein